MESAARDAEAKKYAPRQTRRDSEEPFSQVSCNILIYFSLNDSMDICTFRRKNNLSQMN